MEPMDDHSRLQNGPGGLAVWISKELPRVRKNLQGLFNFD